MYVIPNHRDGMSNMAEYWRAMFEEPPAPDWICKWNAWLGVWPAVGSLSKYQITSTAGQGELHSLGMENTSSVMVRWT